MYTSTIGIKALASLLLLAASLQLGSTQFLEPECGLRSPPVIFGRRNLNDTIAGRTSSPWMVFILTSDDYFICGGTLITNRLVLTAAQCYYSHRHLKVILGEYDTELVDNTRVELNVDMGIMHPNFNYETADNNIAILRLARRVEYRENIRPICIVQDKRWRNYIDGMESLIATGWGKTSPNGRISNILKKVQLRRQTPESCRRYINKAPLDNEFCVGNLDSGLCNGDSGGPIGNLVPYKNKTRFIQVGIASLTNPQCNFASIFTDVLSHVDWILSVKERYGNGDTQTRRVQSPSRRNPNRNIPIKTI